MRWGIQTIIAHLKYIFDGKTTSNLVPWGVVGCLGVISSTAETSRKMSTFYIWFLTRHSSRRDFFFPISFRQNIGAVNRKHPDIKFFGVFRYIYRYIEEKSRKSIDGIETSQKKETLSAYQLTHKINNH